jgi:hypothetical protein
MPGLKVSGHAYNCNVKGAHRQAMRVVVQGGLLVWPATAHRAAVGVQPQLLALAPARLVSLSTPTKILDQAP